MSIAVRQNALQIWKSIVTNTPRTLVEIMKVLLSLLIEKLSEGSIDEDDDQVFGVVKRGNDDEEEAGGDGDNGEDIRIVASRSLGDLVMKLGDKVKRLVCLKKF